MELNKIIIILFVFFLVLHSNRNDTEGFSTICGPNTVVGRNCSTLKGNLNAEHNCERRNFEKNKRNGIQGCSVFNPENGYISGTSSLAIPQQKYISGDPSYRFYEGAIDYAKAYNTPAKVYADRSYYDVPPILPDNSSVGFVTSPSSNSYSIDPDLISKHLGKNGQSVRMIPTGRTYNWGYDYVDPNAPEDNDYTYMTVYENVTGPDGMTRKEKKKLRRKNRKKRKKDKKELKKYICNFDCGTEDCCLADLKGKKIEELIDMKNKIDKSKRYCSLNLDNTERCHKEIIIEYQKLTNEQIDSDLLEVDKKSRPILESRYCEKVGNSKNEKKRCRNKWVNNLSTDDLLHELNDTPYSERN